MKRIVIIILSYVQDILPLHDPEAPDGQHRGHLFRIHTEKPSWGGVHEGHQTRSQKIISINSPATRSTRGINLPPKWINTNLELGNFTFISSPSQISCRVSASPTNVKQLPPAPALRLWLVGDIMISADHRIHQIFCFRQQHLYCYWHCMSSAGLQAVIVWS